MLTLGIPYLGRILVIDAPTNRVLAVVSNQDKRAVSDRRLGFEADGDIDFFRASIFHQLIQDGRPAPVQWPGSDKGKPAPWLPSESDQRLLEAVRDERAAHRATELLMRGGRR